MGGSQSKSVINSISESITNVAMSTVQSCEIVTNQTQNVSAVNTGIRLFDTYSMKQQTDIKSECFSDINRQTELQNQIFNAITQSSEAKSIALLGAFGTSTANATTNLRNMINSKVTLSNIQKSYTEIKQTQNVNFGNSGISIGTKLDLSQGAQVFAAATLQQVEAAGIFNKIGNYVDQKSSATQENPLDFIAKAIGAIGSTIAWSMFSFVFMIIIIGVAITMVFRSGGGNSNQGYNPAQQFSSDNRMAGSFLGRLIKPSQIGSIVSHIPGMPANVQAASAVSQIGAQ